MTNNRWLGAGLFLTTFATLLLELIDSRLFSVLTWYHLSFLAISLAMLGGASGAVLIFLSGSRIQGHLARLLLGRLGIAMSLLIPLTHLALLRMRIPPFDSGESGTWLSLMWAIALATLPFILSGAIVTIALTRCGGRIGLLYGLDLLGAAAGCALVVPLLENFDILSSILFTATAAAAATACFVKYRDAAARLPWALAAVLGSLAVIHLSLGSPVGIAYPRGARTVNQNVAGTYFNAYSHVTVMNDRTSDPFYWGRSRNADRTQVHFSFMLIDGGAGTAITQWNGQPKDLEWVKFDVTSLPYHIRSGPAAIIGVGGGRDILAALWGGSDSITAVEINEIFVDLLKGPYREYAGIADHPRVRLINDEARAWFTRNDQQFEVLQMSLVDTWAATGAGAFTLTENGLYTVEGWRTFLSRLTPNGIFSTSRWFSPRKLSETSRLLSLCVQALLDMGVTNPSQHIALISHQAVATLLVGRSPLSEADLDHLRELSDDYAFQRLIFPGEDPEDPLLQSIMASRTSDELAQATQDPFYDYTAPRDGSPFFFNMLKLASFYHYDELKKADVFQHGGGVIWGNISATYTLGLLFLLAGGLALLIIGGPLLIAGLPEMSRASFLSASAYFAAIGYGFMSIQIPLLQRYSVFLGHPIYTYSVILFSMILAAGLGSFLSDRIERLKQWTLWLPLCIGAAALMLSWGLQSILDATQGSSIGARIAVVIGTTAPIALLMGFCFPMGIRLVQTQSPSATAWMWGLNGVAGVLASIVAVAISMWAGIHTNFLIAAVCYTSLALSSRPLVRTAPWA